MHNTEPFLLWRQQAGVWIYEQNKSANSNVFTHFLHHTFDSSSLTSICHPRLKRNCFYSFLECLINKTGCYGVERCWTECVSNGFTSDTDKLSTRFLRSHKVVCLRICCVSKPAYSPRGCCTLWILHLFFSVKKVCSSKKKKKPSIKQWNCRTHSYIQTSTAIFTFTPAHSQSFLYNLLSLRGKQSIYNTPNPWALQIVYAGVCAAVHSGSMKRDCLAGVRS